MTPTAAPVQWTPEGVPRSALFDDVYRSQGRLGDLGLAQARTVFLQGCGLHGNATAAWAGAHQWHVLETGFGLGLNFLATWAAWRADPQRPERLFYTGIEAWPVSASDLLRSAAPWPELHALAQALADDWQGLLPGQHRWALEGGRVQLTLCVGPVQAQLRELDVAADSVYLDGFRPDANPDMWSAPTLQALSRRCRPGTRLATWCVRSAVRDTLTQCGFAVQRVPGLRPKGERLQAVFEPAWTPRSAVRRPWSTAPHGERQALVLGAGLSGSAVAHSLAQRGWQVTVLDAGDGPGAGASGLPVGLTVPHVSPDDSPLSRISRAGVHATLQRCRALLQPNQHWGPTGVLEHRVEGKRALPDSPAWAEQGQAWSRHATAAHKSDGGLPEAAQALWHPRAAWLQPRALVSAQLATPGVQVRWRSAVQRLQAPAQNPQGLWQALDAQGQVLAQAPLVVVAGGQPSAALLAPWAALPLHALRGQVSLGRLQDLPTSVQAQLPRVPVNGHGSWVSGVPLPAPWGPGLGWVLGSTFEREQPQALLRPEDHSANHARLGRLLPALHAPMAPALTPESAQGWAGVRCTLPDRLPAVGPLDPQGWPGLWTCTGMGARGISLSVLAGECVAAWLEGEPLPLAPSLAKGWAAGRWVGSGA